MKVGIKMRIGIDIDDTALKTVNSMIKYADKYDVEDLGKKGTNGNLGLIKNRYYLKILYGWDDETKFAFFKKYYKNVLEECIPMEHAVEVLNRLKEEGYEIYFISARLTNIEGCNAEAITKETFQKYNIPYDKLIVNAREKLPVIKENKIDLYIEDSFETVRELTDNGIKALLMTTKMNKDLSASDIKRVETWDEVYDYIKGLNNEQ